MEARIEDGKLIIEIPVNNPAYPSKSGKTLIVASTHGNKKVEIGGENITIGLNAYKYRS